jgi:phosphohistidine phosphatase
MKTLLILRHAKSDPGAPGMADRDRPLNAKGRAAAEAMGRYLLERGHAPDLVLCSPSLRTRETLGCLPGELVESARERFDEFLYLADAGEIRQSVSEIDDAVSTALLIGHNPALQELACALAIKGDRDSRETMARRFTPSSCAVIGFETGGWAEALRGGRLLDFKRAKDLRI